MEIQKNYSCNFLRSVLLYFCAVWDANDNCVVKYSLIKVCSFRIPEFINTFLSTKLNNGHISFSYSTEFIEWSKMYWSNLTFNYSLTTEFSNKLSPQIYLFISVKNLYCCIAHFFPGSKLSWHWTLRHENYLCTKT